MVSAVMMVTVFLWSTIRLLLIAVIAIGVWHRWTLLWRRWRVRGSALAAGFEVEDWRQLPAVTVQLPVYNERFVIERLLEAVGNLDYPQEKLQIQVLDDSDAGDGTSEAIDSAVEGLLRQGWHVDVQRRRERSGYKAGALQEGLASATGELVAIFDADFVPQADFLLRVVGYFSAPDSGRLGMVQARWGFLNAEVNWLTRVQAWFLDAHFRIEQAARNRSACCFNFNGTAGIWRRQCIEEAGGWQGETLTEDLDLSYRAQIKGWRFAYVDEVVVPSELPTSWAAFKVQQFRWAKGATQVARKLMAEIWGQKSLLATRAKWEATMHLTSQAAYLVFPVLLVGGTAAALLGAWPSDGIGVLLRVVGALAMLTALAFFSSACLLSAPRRPLSIRDHLALWLTVPVAIGLAISNSWAVIEAGLGRHSPFQRTPKRGGKPMDTRMADHYRSAAPTVLGALELACGLGLLAVLVASLMRTEIIWLHAVLLLPGVVGFLWSGLASLSENIFPPGRTSEGHNGAVDEPNPDSASLRDQSQKSADISPSTP